MNKFVKVCLILTAVFAVLGMMLCGIGAAAGATRLATGNELAGTRLGEWISDIRAWGWNDGWNWNWDDDWNWDWDDDWDGRDELNYPANGAAEDYTYTKEEIRNLNIDIKAGEMTIVESADENIHVQIYSKRSKATVAVEDKELQITEQGTKQYVNRRLEITLFIPKGVTFDTINMTANAGEINSAFDDLAAKRVNLQVDAGEMVITSLNSEETLKATVGAGNVNLTKLTAKDVDLDCGIGELTMEGRVTGNLTGKNGVGSLLIIIEGSEDDFNYFLKCGIGAIIIDNTRYGSLGSTRSYNNGAAREMSLDCGIGEIEVTFE